MRITRTRAPVPRARRVRAAGLSPFIPTQEGTVDPPLGRLTRLRVGLPIQADVAEGFALGVSTLGIEFAIVAPTKGELITICEQQGFEVVDRMVYPVYVMKKFRK